MQDFTVRAAEGKDTQTYVDWLQAASDINLVDKTVYSYPTCNTLVIEKSGDPVLMNSFHLVSMMEALAPKPGLPPRDEARALRALFDSVKGIAEVSAVKEVWFGCSDERVQRFAQRHGVERVNFPMFRMRIK